MTLTANQINPFLIHLYERGLFQTPVINYWADWDNEIVTFPLWTAGGGLVGYQRYTWHEEKKRANGGKYFTWITDLWKPCAFWGMEYALNWGGYKYKSRSLLITEGVWDALRCLQQGYRACAILSATPNRQFTHWFRQLTHNQRVVAIKDNDLNNAGNGLDKLADVGYNVERHKDIGEHTPYEAHNWLYKIDP